MTYTTSLARDFVYKRETMLSARRKLDRFYAACERENEMPCERGCVVETFVDHDDPEHEVCALVCFERDELLKKWLDSVNPAYEAEKRYAAWLIECRRNPELQKLSVYEVWGSWLL